jgi:hypothetical protein
MLNPTEAADLIETASEYAGSLELEIERIISNADSIDNADPKLRALAETVRRMASTLKKAGV